MMNPSPNIQHTALLTALHLLVDGMCACSVFMLQGALTGVGVAVLFVTYNVLAFMTQPFVGMWMDRRRPGVMCLWAAVLLLLSGGLLTTLYPLFATDVAEMAISAEVAELVLLAVVAVLLGMGNSLFHVFGGKCVTESTVNDPRHLGFFVSSGALGLALGGTWHSLTLMGALAVAMVGVVALFQRCVLGLQACSLPCDQSQGTTDAEPTAATSVTASAQESTSVTASAQEGASAAAPALLLFMLLLVFGRSFVGNIRPESVQDVAYYAAIAGVLAFVGKASGGFVARRVGVWTTLTAVLMVSGVCLLLSGLHWVFAVLMVLAINLSMPLTLHLANRSMPQRAGFAFGALAFMLIPGHALSLYLAGQPIILPLLYALVATIIIEALVLLAFGERRWTVLGASVAMNVLTNVPLNIVVSHMPALHASIAGQIVLEAVVLAIETVLFWLVMKDRRQAFIYALACNATSYLCGVAFSLVYFSFL